MEKPSVLVYVCSPDTAAIAEIIAGAEEEGFGLVVKEAVDDDGLSTDDMTADRMSLKAAQSGTFGIGIGVVGKTATMSARTGKRPIFILRDADAGQYRRLGQNTGRYIKKEPFLPE